MHKGTHLESWFKKWHTPSPCLWEDRGVPSCIMHPLTAVNQTWDSFGKAFSGRFPVAVHSLFSCIGLDGMLQFDARFLGLSPIHTLATTKGPHLSRHGLNTPRNFVGQIFRPTCVSLAQNQKLLAWYIKSLKQEESSEQYCSGQRLQGKAMPTYIGGQGMEKTWFFFWK